MNENTSISIGFLIFPGFPMACLTSMIEPLRAANEISGVTAFEWNLISEDNEEVFSSAHVGFRTSIEMSEISKLTHIFLLSSPSAQFEQSETISTLRSLNRHGMIIGSISGGVFPLVRAKLNQDKPVSVHWCYEAAFRKEFPKVKSSDKVIELEKSCITASGAAAAFDIALYLIENSSGLDVATEVACWFQHPMMRKDNVQQTVPILNTDTTDSAMPSSISRAISLMADNLENPISIAEIADELEISPRHVERSFKKTTGLSPTHYYRAMRMKAARQLVMYSNDRISEIANTVGYLSIKAFNTHYKEAYKVTPKEDRQRINLYRVESNTPIPSV